MYTLKLNLTKGSMGSPVHVEDDWDGNEDFWKGDTRQLDIASYPVFERLFQRQGKIEYPCKLLSFFVDKPYEELLEHLHIIPQLDTENSIVQGNIGGSVFEFQGKKIGLEMNANYTEDGMRGRMYMGFHRYTENRIDENDVYDYVIQIHLNYFLSEEKSTEDPIHVVYVKDDKNKTKVRQIVFVHIDLEWLQDKWFKNKNGVNGLEEVDRFFLTLIQVDMEIAGLLAQNNPVMMKYVKDATKIYRRENWLSFYDYKDAIKEEYTGRHEESIERMRFTISKRLLENDVDLKLIADCTEENIATLIKMKEELEERREKERKEKNEKKPMRKQKEQKPEAKEEQETEKEEEESSKSVV